MVFQPSKCIAGLRVGVAGEALPRGERGLHGQAGGGLLDMLAAAFNGETEGAGEDAPHEPA